MQSKNVVLVTPPDIYLADQPTLLLIGLGTDHQQLVESMRRMPMSITVYATDGNESLDWLAQAQVKADLTLLNCAYNDITTGFFIDKPNVYYYNNTIDYTTFNVNHTADPMDVLIQWMKEWLENQDKNVA